MMSRRMIPPLRGRIDDCTDPTVMKQIRINQLDVGEESIDELLGTGLVKPDEVATNAINVFNADV
jgi:hypothetical protein